MLKIIGFVLLLLPTVLSLFNKIDEPDFSVIRTTGKKPNADVACQTINFRFCQV